MTSLPLSRWPCPPVSARQRAQIGSTPFHGDSPGVSRATADGDGTKRFAGGMVTQPPGRAMTQPVQARLRASDADPVARLALKSDLNRAQRDLLKFGGVTTHRNPTPMGLIGRII